MQGTKYNVDTGTTSTGIRYIKYKVDQGFYLRRVLPRRVQGTKYHVDTGTTSTGIRYIKYKVDQGFYLRRVLPRRGRATDPLARLARDPIARYTLYFILYNRTVYSVQYTL